MKFPRIDPNHPLTEAARYTNAYTEEHGLQETLDWLGMKVDAGELMYLGEQRALRAIAASQGINLSGRSAIIDEAVVEQITKSALWQPAMRMLLIACYADGMAIGWKAHELSSGS